MTEKKTLTLKTRRTSSGNRTLRGKKRIVVNPEATRQGKVKKQPRTPRQPPSQPKIKKIPPSEIRMRELDNLLNARFAAWRDNEPLQFGIEKQIYRLISAEHLPFSKRVVQRLLRQHTRCVDYLNKVEAGELRFTLRLEE